MILIWNSILEIKNQENIFDLDMKDRKHTLFTALTVYNLTVKLLLCYNIHMGLNFIMWSVTFRFYQHLYYYYSDN